MSSQREVGGQRLSPELNGQNSPRVEAQAARLEILSSLENPRYDSPTSLHRAGAEVETAGSPGRLVGICNHLGPDIIQTQAWTAGSLVEGGGEVRLVSTVARRFCSLWPLSLWS